MNLIDFNITLPTYQSKNKKHYYIQVLEHSANVHKKTMKRCTIIANYNHGIDDSYYVCEKFIYHNHKLSDYTFDSQAYYYYNKTANKEYLKILFKLPKNDTTKLKKNYQNFLVFKLVHSKTEDSEISIDIDTHVLGTSRTKIKPLTANKKFLNYTIEERQNLIQFLFKNEKEYFELCWALINE